MAISNPSARLRRLAFLYLGMAHRSDRTLSDAELESVIRRLADWDEGGDRGAVQAIVMDVLACFVGGFDSRAEVVRRAAADLGEELEVDERRAVMKDLGRIARADGVVLDDENQMLKSLAEIWNVSLRDDAEAVDLDRWSVLHDLAYIYLLLAHSTDNDFSGTERQVIVSKLREWHPGAPEEYVDRMLHLAMSEYARGHDEDRLDAAVSSVRAALPREQRMAALNDLVKIANADGVFLDNEEDLINHLQTAWEVDPSANYEPHSDKTVDG